MPTMPEVRRITWSIYWKFTLFSFIAGFCAGAVVGTIIGASVTAVYGPGAMYVQPWPNVNNVASFVAGLIAGFFVLNYLIAKSIGKQFGSKKLVLVDAFAAGEK
jgi:fructose-specific phosphotransferase system IIC component